MVFKWRISRPAFHGIAANVEVTHAAIEVEFETGSIGEAHGIFSDNGTALAEMFGGSIMGRASDLATKIEPPQGEQTDNGISQAEQAGSPRRGRPRKDKNQPDPTIATAPDPVTIPGVEAPPTASVNTAPGDSGIPAFLDRTIAPPPPAPPVPPAAPPTGVLASKIAAELDRRATGAPDGGQALADWLATSGITVKGATYAEAVTVLRLQADEKLGPIARALGVAA